MYRTFALMCFALLTFCSTTAIAATFCVNDATKLREALITAAANGQADVIQLERGVYRGGFVYASGADSGAEGSVKLQGGFGVGCSSRIVSASNTVLDGRSRSRVLGLFGHYGEDFAIEGLTLKNGYAKGPGGGVYVSTDAEFLMTHTTVDANVSRNGEHAGVGGGLYVKATVVDISSHSRVTNNRADSDGGGLYVDARILSVTDSRILENSSRGDGGGLRATTDDLILEDNYLFDNNATGRGGGAYIDGDPDVYQLALTRNWILRNVAGTEGGGIHILGIGADGAFRKNHIFYNRASMGGGLYVDGHLSAGNDEGNYSADDRSSHIVLADNRIEGNQASAHGGGAVLREALSATLTGNLIVLNEAGADGGGVFLFSIGDVLVVSNTTAKNVADSEGGGFHVRFATDLGIYNTLFYSDDAGAYSGGDHVYATNVHNLQRSVHNRGDGTWARCYQCLKSEGWTTAEPNFVDEQLGDYRLSADSPLLDAGRNTAPGMPVYDHDGAPRIHNGVTDIGAFEYPGPNAAPSIAATPAALDFGAVSANQNAEYRTIILANTGDVPLVLWSINLPNPGAYTLVNDDCSWRTLGPSANCLVEVAFRPFENGLHTASMVVASSDPSHPEFIVALHGIGRAQVGGATTAMDSVNVTCENLASGRKGIVRFSPTETSWNCEERGLKVKSGDNVRLVVTGKAK